jgi:putative FmdB family regulatory protein
MIPWSQDYKCKECGHRMSLIVDKQTRDEPRECAECGGEAPKTFSMPNVMRVNTTDQAIPQTIKDLKRAAEMEVEMYDLPHDKRGEMKKEIDKLKGTKPVNED